MSEWTPVEDRMLAKHFRKHGSVWDGWARVLPGRSRNSIAARANRLGLEWPRPRRNWTDLEDEVIVRYYPEHGLSWDGWGELLPGRTAQAISARASKIGVRSANRSASSSRARAAAADGRRCGDCLAFVPSGNPLVDAGVCTSTRAKRWLGVSRNPSVLASSDAGDCDFYVHADPRLY